MTNLFNNNNTQQTARNLFNQSQNQNRNLFDKDKNANSLIEQPKIAEASKTVPFIRKPGAEGDNQSTEPKGKVSNVKFKQVFKLMEAKPELLQKIEKSELKQSLKLSLQYFDRSAEKSQKFQEDHVKKANFGFAPEDLGHDGIKLKLDQVNQFWKVVVQHASQISNVSQLLICQYLREYIRMQKIYQKKFFIKQIHMGNPSYAPNEAFVKSLYNNLDNNNRQVAIYHPLFVQIFEFLILEAFSQITAMLKIIQMIQNKNKRFFRDVIKKENCDYFSVLWKKYQYFSGSYIRKQKISKDSKDPAKAKRIQEFYNATKKFGIEAKIRKHKIMIGMHIGAALINVLDEYGTWRQKKQPIVSKLIRWQEAIKFIDQDLCVLTDENSETPINEYKYAQISLQLLLKLVPLCVLSKVSKCSFMNQKDIQAMRQVILKTKSIYLQSFRFLFLFYTSEKINRQKVNQSWRKVTKSVQWIMRSERWSQWIAIALQIFKSELFSCEELLNQAVKMLKIIVKSNADEFWDEENQNYEYRIISYFLLKQIDTNQVKYFLPVYIKCLGEEPKKTFSEMLLQKKEIVLALSQSLEIEQLSGRRNSNINASMFYSRSSDYSNYSEVWDQRSQGAFEVSQQYIKFFCKMIRNCKEDLSVVESKFWSSIAPRQSTGIFVCQFLFRILAKLKQYKVGSLKSMRYIVQTINTLFICPQSRKALMIAMSYTFTNKNQQNKNQLEIMINYACEKPSTSEQYRQSQKLRKVISYHLCSILRVSKYMTEYFPFQEDFKQERKISLLDNLISSRNYSNLFLEYKELRSYHPTPWLANFLLILQSPNLLPIDFETIRLILIKLKIDKDWKRQYQFLEEVVNILNRSDLTEVIFSCLQPSFNIEEQQRGSRYLFFGLMNQKLYELFDINRKKNVVGVYKDDSSLLKIKQKQNHDLQQQQQIIVGNIAGALELIGAILRNKNVFTDTLNENFPLIRKLKVYNEICSCLTDTNSLYHYQVPIRHASIEKNKVYPISRNEDFMHINIIQVICSYINFQTRYQLPQKNHWNKQYIEEIVIDQQISIENQSSVQKYRVHNLLLLDENELTLNTDYTIGIGCVFKVLNQIMVSRGGLSLFFKSINNPNYNILQEDKSFISQNEQFTVFIKEVIRMLNSVQQSIQIQTIFEFLTIGVSLSYIFIKQLVNTNLLQKLRRVLKAIIGDCTREEKIYIYNKVSLFALAVSQYRQNYQQEVDSFVRLPTNIVYDILIEFSKAEQLVKDSFNFKELQTLSYVRSRQYYEKMGLKILYKGTINICVNLMKRYFQLEPTSHNTEIFSLLFKMAHCFLFVPVKPEVDYILTFKLKQKNSISVPANSVLCFVQPSIGKKFQQKFKSLSNFVFFMPSLNYQFGRNYQFEFADVFAKSLYLKYKNSDQATREVINIYRINYQASLDHCHSMMVTSFLQFMMVVGTTGQYGHELSFAFQDKLQGNFQQKTNNMRNNKAISAEGQLLDMYKYRNSKAIDKNLIIAHSTDQSFQLVYSYLQNLIRYFESDHEKQYLNDLVLYNIALFLKQANKWYANSSRMNKLKKLCFFILDSTRIRFKVSPRIFTLFISSLAQSFINLGVSTSSKVQQICEIIKTIVIYGGNLLSTNHELIYLQQIYNQNTLQENIFLFAAILAKVMDFTTESFVEKGSIFKMVIDTAEQIVDKYLVNFELADINNLAIIKLVNVLLIHVEEYLLSLNRRSDKQEKKAIDSKLSNIIIKYTKFVIKGLQTGEKQGVFPCFLLESLTIVQLFSCTIEYQIHNLILNFITTQFDSTTVKKSLVSSQNNSFINTQKTSQKPKSSQKALIPQYYSCLILDPPTFTLQKVVETSKLLFLLSSITKSELDWSNQRNMLMLQTVFNAAINQDFLFSLTKNRKSKNRLLSTSIPIRSDSQSYLQELQIFESKEIRQKKAFSSGYGPANGINLFEFSVHIQISHAIFHYLLILIECFDKSESLKKFYSKMLNRNNFIDELIWQKISNALICCLSYLREYNLSLIKLFPKSLTDLLRLNSFVSKSTDFSFNMHFLNTCLDIGGIFSIDNDIMVREYKIFVMNIVISLCWSSIKFVEIWRQNDWRSSVDWDSGRQKLILEMEEIYKQSCRLTLPEEQESIQIQKMKQIEKWFNRNRTTHKSD